MALELVTGYQGQDHVTAEQWADFNRGIYGDAAILPVGSEMAVDIQTANQITVKDGIGVFDGREVYIGYGEMENIAIASGTQGMLRNDIVVIKYTKQEESGVEGVAFEVVEGTPAASNQTDPAYSDQDIRTGVFTSQKPFCRVRINGTAIEGIDMLVDVKEIKEHAFNDLANNLTTTEPGHALDARQGRELKQDVDELNSALAHLSGITSTLTNGGVEFTSRVYQAGEVHIDGTVSTDQCEIMYMRIYSQSDRSLLIGTMVSASDGEWWNKYVASGTVLVTKNVGSEWYGWTSLTTSV